VQFAAASFLLVVALVMAQQDSVLKERALHFAPDPVVVVENTLDELRVSFDTLRQELLRNPDIKAVASAARPPWQNGGPHVALARYAEAGAAHEDTILNLVGYHFFDVLGLKLLAGRLLDEEHGDEATRFDSGKPEMIVIDRGLAATLGWKDPDEALDRVVYATFGSLNLSCRIVGVVENGYPRLADPDTTSNIYMLSPILSEVPLIRISREHVPQTMKYIDATWDRIAPKLLIKREFMDALFESAYLGYARINAMLNGLCIFAFLIAVMGLCGLAIFVTTRRQREIGIRKTLGASVRGVVTMLLVDFAKPVLVANVMAWPFAWLVSHQYLNKFTLRGEITIWPFAVSLAITVGVAWAAVAIQAVRAANVKPARVLYAQ